MYENLRLTPQQIPIFIHTLQLVVNGIDAGKVVLVAEAEDLKVQLRGFGEIELLALIEIVVTGTHSPKLCAQVSNVDEVVDLLRSETPHLAFKFKSMSLVVDGCSGQILSRLAFSSFVWSRLSKVIVYEVHGPADTMTKWSSGHESPTIFYGKDTSGSGDRTRWKAESKGEGKRNEK
ncbi:hypothetical protein E2542_SST16375 [Spatholobus suberectus]|nr:hypothetical protein E2542_SST16375 [Spatholobus suberectus]